jgi:hypothetical protein
MGAVDKGVMSIELVGFIAYGNVNNIEGVVTSYL